MAIFNEADEEALENELNKGALWAVTYGDLMSYLFIFFLIMFVFQATKTEKAQEQLTQPTKITKTVEEKALDDKGIEQIAKVELQQDRIRLTFTAPILFDAGNAKVKPSAVPDLKKLAEVLKSLPNSVIIEGHTDDTPMGPHMQRRTGFHDNWQLSTARAINVLRFFVEQGVPPARLAAVGYAEFHPVVKNDNTEDRAKNRRIEVDILRQETGS